MPRTSRRTNVIEMPSAESLGSPSFMTGRSLTHDEIALRAYEIYNSRGQIDGADVDDWLQAERELAGLVKAS